MDSQHTSKTSLLIYNRRPSLKSNNIVKKEKERSHDESRERDGRKQQHFV